MNVKVSKRDYETLSAYLDGVLEIRDQIRLEKRLKVEDELVQELTALKRTRLILRNQPRLRAPRNFTLTSQMAGVKTKAHNSIGAYPALRLASILASVFFLVVMAGDLIGTSLKPQTIASSNLPQQEAPVGIPGFGMGGGGGGDASLEVVPAPQEEAAMEPNAVAPTQGATLKAIPRENQLQPEAALQVAPPSISESEAVTNAEHLLLPGSEPEGLTQDADLKTTEEEARQTSWPFIRIMLVILAILAIGTGLGALYEKTQISRL